MKCTNKISYEIISIPPLIDNKKLLIALSITDTNLTELIQDQFKNHTNLQTIDLKSNKIEKINANAFRGLEDVLHQLDLSNNNLKIIPYWTLIYLHKLQYLHLRNNQISKLDPLAFEKTELRNLHYLHLDDNQMTNIPSNLFTKLSLNVLTLSNNRLIQIEPNSIPSTISYLSLKKNLLQSFPYDACSDFEQLEILDMDNNNVERIEMNNKVKIHNPFSLILSNNRLTKLGDYAFGSFQKFNRLDLSYNQISEVHKDVFAGVNVMKHLDLSYNNIISLPPTLFMNLEKSVKWLSLDYNNLHVIPVCVSSLLVLEHLNLNNNKLNNLGEALTSSFSSTIKELSISSNRLLNFSFPILRGLQQLTNLDISKNRIKHLSSESFLTFDNGSKLIKLNLASNMIENITDEKTFSHLHNLVYLDLSYNNIQFITDNIFSGLTNIKQIFLQGNKLTKFMFRTLNNLRNLKVLILDNNRIKNLDGFSLYCKSLEHLSVIGNELTDISPNYFYPIDLANLKVIQLSKNNIKRIIGQTFRELPRVQFINLEYNQIEEINSFAFNFLPNLVELNLAGNRLKTISENAFHNLANLKSLNLASNQISKTFQDRIFRNVNNLASLNLSYNLLKEFNGKVMSYEPIGLKLIDLSYNRLQSVDLSHLKQSLVTLILAGNSLIKPNRITFQDFHRLEYLDLDNNQIIDLSNDLFLGSKNLVELILSNNMLTHIRANTFTDQSVKILDLSYNRIFKMDEDVFKSNGLEKLDLSNNILSEVPIACLRNIKGSLTLLNLNNNNIENIIRDQFKGFENITHLYLNNNNIHTIDEEAFKGLKNLQVLELSHNPITSWSPNALSRLSSQLAELNLANTGLFYFPKISSNVKVKKLNISSNNLKDLSSFNDNLLTKLVSLDVSDNNLQHLSVKSFSQMQSLLHLYLDGNTFVGLPVNLFYPLKQLETLSISRMKYLKTLPSPRDFQKLQLLSTLYLYDLPQVNEYNINQILDHIAPLKYLKIEIKEDVLNQQLYSLDTRKLRYLCIYGKRLKQISTGAFSKIKGFKVTIAVENTSIETFPSSVFSTLSSISYLQLSLRNNKIKQFIPFANTKPPMINQYGTILQSLDLQGNPLVCHCEDEALSFWIQYLETNDNSDAQLAILKKTKCINMKKDKNITLFDMLSCQANKNGYSSNANSEYPKYHLNHVFVIILMFYFAILNTVYY
uniref:LRRCT domain-containing protein n=1 Tax=Rhabditophanes sp. KR3021 TaxID=114890 RepID=A0AC35U7D6_9BILA